MLAGEEDGDTTGGGDAALLLGGPLGTPPAHPVRAAIAAATSKPVLFMVAPFAHAPMSPTFAHVTTYTPWMTPRQRFLLRYLPAL